MADTINTMTIMDFIPQLGFAGVFGYQLWILWQSNKAKDDQIKLLNEKVLDAFNAQVKQSEVQTTALQELRKSNESVVLSNTAVVENVKANTNATNHLVETLEKGN